MQPVDIALIIILAFGAYKGFRKGLFMEIVTIIAFFLAIIISFNFMGMGVEMLSTMIEGWSQWLPYLAFFLIFVLSLVTIHLVGKGIKKFMDLTLLGNLDDLAGAVVGLLKWALIISLVLWLFGSMGVSLPNEYTQEAVLYPWIAGFAPSLVGLFSDFLPALDYLLEGLKRDDAARASAQIVN